MYNHKKSHSTGTLLSSVSTGVKSSSLGKLKISPTFKNSPWSPTVDRHVESQKSRCCGVLPPTGPKRSRLWKRKSSSDVYENPWLLMVESPCHFPHLEVFTSSTLKMTLFNDFIVINV